MKDNKHIFSVDVVRSLATVLVVIIHTANAVYARPDFIGGVAWWFASILNSISRISIPLFILLSGFLILQKNESFNLSLKRIYSRLLIPLISWVIIYLVWNDGTPSLSGLSTIFSRLYSGSFLHLYFLVLMIGLYFVAPVIRSFIRSTDKKTIKTITGTLLVICSAIVVGDYIYRGCTYISLTMWVPYVGLFVAGYYIGKVKAGSPITKKHVAAYIAALLMTIAFSYNYALSLKQGFGVLPSGCITTYVDNYVSVNVVIMSLSAFFILIRLNYSKVEKGFFGRLVRSIAQASFGIYLVHILIIQFSHEVLNLHIDALQINLFVYIVISFVFVFGISYGLTLVARRIPFIKRIF